MRGVPPKGVCLSHLLDGSPLRAGASLVFDKMLGAILVGIFSIIYPKFIELTTDVVGIFLFNMNV